MGKFRKFKCNNKYPLLRCLLDEWEWGWGGERHPEEGQLLIRPSGREKLVYMLKQMHIELTTVHTSLLKWKWPDLCCVCKCVCMSNCEKRRRQQSEREKFPDSFPHCICKTPSRVFRQQQLIIQMSHVLFGITDWYTKPFLWCKHRAKSCTLPFSS